MNLHNFGSKTLKMNKIPCRSQASNPRAWNLREGLRVDLILGLSSRVMGTWAHLFGTAGLLKIWSEDAENLELYHVECHGEQKQHDLIILRSAYGSNVKNMGFSFLK